MISYRQADIRDKISQEYVGHRVLMIDSGFINDPVISQHGTKLTFPDRTIDLAHFAIVSDTAPTQFPILFLCGKEHEPFIFKWSVYKINSPEQAPVSFGRIDALYANATMETTTAQIIDLNVYFLFFRPQEEAIYISHR